MIVCSKVLLAKRSLQIRVVKQPEFKVISESFSEYEKILRFYFFSKMSVVQKTKDNRMYEVISVTTPKGQEF